ncbi:DUF3742 family protein [Pseudomonas corrugata]|uniref:DUF3742 family protein n=1 Tax=Pseudomonas corrugata TaxID=47879 RepID=UPI0006D8C93D
MREQEQATRAEKLGEYAGRCWRSYLRVLDRLSGGLQRAGAPYALSRMIAWGLQALVLFVLLYVAFWITIIFIVVALGSSGLLDRSSGVGGLGAEWRDGPSGFGIYDQAGVRIDPHDPDEVP